jgi:hypothetical protein
MKKRRPETCEARISQLVAPSPKASQPRLGMPKRPHPSAPMNPVRLRGDETLHAPPL